MPKKKSFILYAEYIRQVQILSDEDAGKLFKAILEYVNTKELPTLDGMAAMAFSFIANQLDGDLQRYNEVCQKRAENIKKRWAKDSDNTSKPVVSDKEDIHLNTNEYKCIQNDTNAYKKIQMDSDTDTVTDTDTDTVTDTVLRSSVSSKVPARGTHNNVRLTTEQYKSLCDKYGDTIVNAYVDKISEYIKSSGKKPYRNHYNTIVKWIEEDGAKAQPSKQPSFDLDLIVNHAIKNKPEV